MVLSSCGPAPQAPSPAPPPRLVLLYATCSLNKNYLEPYNPQVTFTPSIAEFADRGIVFLNHRSQVGISGPSYATLFTGSYMSHHGIYSHPKILSDRVYTIAEAFGDAGYDTFSSLGHGMANARLNYAQGVPDDHRLPGLIKAEVDGLRHVLAELQRDPAYRAFVVVNFTVTHGPYNPDAAWRTHGAGLPVDGPSDGVREFCRLFPEECQQLTDPGLRRFREIFLADPHIEQEPDLVHEDDPDEVGVEELAAVVEIVYKSNVFRLDRLFGRIVGEIEQYGLLDVSLIVFTADHGEYLYEKGRALNWSHGKLLTPMDLEPPLIMVAPAIGLDPSTVSEVTRHIDVFPTMAGLAGAPIPDAEWMAMSGEDLSAALLGREPIPHLLAFSSTALSPYIEKYNLATRDPQTISVAVRNGSMVYKLMTGQPDKGIEGGALAFDLSRDPKERDNLFDPRGSGSPPDARPARPVQAAFGRGPPDVRRRAAGQGVFRQRARRDAADPAGPRLHAMIDRWTWARAGDVYGSRRR